MKEKTKYIYIYEQKKKGVCTTNTYPFSYSKKGGQYLVISPSSMEVVL